MGNFMESGGKLDGNEEGELTIGVEPLRGPEMLDVLGSRRV